MNESSYNICAAFQTFFLLSVSTVCLHRNLHPKIKNFHMSNECNVKALKCRRYFYMYMHINNGRNDEVEISEF